MSQLKIKNGATWEEIPAGGIGVPSGGDAGDILVKSSSADYATEWSTPEVTELMLYNAGDECTSITGGWMFCNRLSASTASGTGTKKSAYIYIKNATNGSWSAVTTNQIDFTDFNFIEVMFSSSGISDYSVISASSSFPVSSPTLSANIIGRIGDANCPQLNLVSIADLTGSYRIAIQAYLVETRVYRVRLLK